MKGTGVVDGAPKALLARALYDNCPDCSDELAFSRGDILTILEQHVPESEGWWKCLLHGRQGLAPANRLQILTEVTADRPCPPFPRGLEETPASSEETYQVPTLPCPPTPGPVYEQMRSWVEGPQPPSAQVYEFPDPPTSARIICEKTLSFAKQAIITLPRPARASLPTLPSQVYDVPTQHRSPVVLKEPEKQQLYDIPASPKKAGLHPPAGQASNPGLFIPQPSSQQTPERKHRLSEHCRLYFGALFKAISAFHDGLSSSQPAEIITQSKLVITVGQKLVDTLCMETQERDVRNEILRGSSHLCSLLKDVALATKNAVLTYPSPAALGHLQAEAEKLERHTRQFRGTLG
ncbi:cas scaffolding protein family member 4 isoform X5 [Trachypithecus francoisi]|uniref:cas scaffolding protein family member 4 isoform X5 n=1 Tax=Trachypithecus francoisi TaxID=54180 RepID=UPI00141A7020|nr:cas scaffolding protein family member 4 isoform X5 [Trachypithecus francoisi]